MLKVVTGKEESSRAVFFSKLGVSTEVIGGQLNI
jgi:hypothetical protein